MALDFGYSGGTSGGSNGPKKKPQPKPAPVHSFTPYIPPSSSGSSSSSRNSGSGSGSSSSNSVVNDITNTIASAVPDITPVESSIDPVESDFGSFMDDVTSRLAGRVVEKVTSKLEEKEEIKSKGVDKLLADLVGGQQPQPPINTPSNIRNTREYSKINPQTNGSPAASAAVGPRSVTVRDRSPYFTDEQLANAQAIANVGNKMDMSKRDIITSLMTAMQESTLRNLDYGDRDSLGLFQQRPSMGWGSPEQVTDPEYAAAKFFEGLRGVENRNQMPLTAAAQAVQRSAYPDAYAKWEDEARHLIQMRGRKQSGGQRDTASGRPYFRGLNNLLIPVEGATLADMTSDYGPRTHPVTGRASNHTGVDLSASQGTPIYAPQNAIVETINPGDSIYGNQAILRHGRDIQTMYGHMAGFADLDVGEKIKKGEVLGYVGSTGLSTGPHLHWETWLRGQPVNPVEFVQGNVGRTKPHTYKDYRGSSVHGASAPPAAPASSGPRGSSHVPTSSGPLTAMPTGSSGLSGGSIPSSPTGPSSMPSFQALLNYVDGSDFNTVDFGSLLQSIIASRTSSRPSPKVRQRAEKAEQEQMLMSYLSQVLGEKNAMAFVGGG